MVFNDIPATLPKSIATYLRKSNELEQVDSIMSYFCKLYAVEEILDSGVHTTDNSIAVLAGELLDSIENQKKDESSGISEIVNDKDVSISYVLNFSDGIFNNSLKQITEKRSNKSTAFNLLQSLTFYEILKLWSDDYEGFGEIVEDSELSKRKKYAKFHAARILKILKTGGDPNEYTAPKEPEEKVNDDDEVLETINKAVNQPDDDDDDDDDDKFPIIEPDGSNSDGLGLPNVKPTIIQSRSPTLEPKELDSPTNEIDEADDISNILPIPPTSKPKHIEEEEEEEDQNEYEQFDNDLGLPSAPGPLPTLPKIPTSKPTVPSSPPFKAVTPKISPSPPSAPSPPVIVVKKEEKINVDEIIESNEIYSNAQRHAKFAISAMNYEDKETSIRELQNAIALLNKLKE